MNKSMRNKPQHHVKDRLSELPHSIIFHIFWFVPMIDVVRTTILSKQWRNLWTTIPFLNFDNDTSDTDKFRNFVNRALLRWNGIKILKLKVDFHDEIDDSIYNDSELWMNFAKDKGVEELHLHMLIDQIVPQCLYSCSSLKLLSFEFCYFRINGNVQWNQLKSLTINEGLWVSERVINQILSGSPRLEVFNLSFVDSDENLNIRSNSLKELLIRKYIDHLQDISFISELTICTPNLQTLKIEGIPYTNCRLINVSSLTHATIGFCGLLFRDEDDCDFPSEFDLPDGFYSSQDYFGDVYRQILQSIQHVESVTLFYSCLKVLEAMKMRCTHSFFPNVKFLKIGCCYDNYEQFEGLVEIFPHLERLVLQDKEEMHWLDVHEALKCDAISCKDDPKAVKCAANISKSFLLLRTIEVTWINGDRIFPAIEILLKYASQLEKLVIRVKRFTSQDSLLLASKKLLNMPRSSTNCTIDFLY